MEQQKVRFLYPRCARAGTANFVVGFARADASVLTEEGDGFQSQGLRFLERQQDVLGLTAGAEYHQAVARAAEGFHLPFEYAVELVVVADSSQVSAMRVQA